MRITHLTQETSEVMWALILPLFKAVAHSIADTESTPLLRGPILPTLSAEGTDPGSHTQYRVSHFLYPEMIGPGWCWNTESNQTDKTPCLHGAYPQLRETVKNKSTHLKKLLMKQAPPWKDHLIFHPLHPTERKTQLWRWQSGSSLDLESTSSASPWPTGSNRDDVLNALAELCCGLSELITAPSYAGVSIQGFSQIWVLLPFCGGTFPHNKQDVLGLQDTERNPSLYNQSRNISLLTHLENSKIVRSTIIDSLTEHPLGVRHCATSFPWGMPSSS
uniref:LOW QUALITY PROTEIN: talanin n=1 Tax=Callithrix jacchus TaxID=9483 RepID=UPI0023DD572D|nr:LOW QUALITY PROTEIN: talanin [Callithrix jacchus]